MLAGVGCAGDEFEIDVGGVGVVAVDGDGGVELEEAGFGGDAEAWGEGGPGGVCRAW